MALVVIERSRTTSQPLRNFLGDGDRDLLVRAPMPEVRPCRSSQD